MQSTRRDFLGGVGAGIAVLAFRPPLALARGLGLLRFGMCADVHKDVMHDADDRLGAFLEAMVEKKAHFVAQMGDFCQPIERNDSFRRVWESFPGDRYNVLGNHDMDGGASRGQARAYLGMKEGHYSFVQQGYRFIVLDGNDRHEGAPPGYPRHVGAPQQAWLKGELAATKEPVIVLIHQSLANGEGVDNGAEVRAILEHANEEAGWGRVLACFSGHHHLDHLDRIGDIPYVQVNSMSYYWVGRKRKHESYSAKIHAEHPWIECTSPYKDPLWTFVTLDPAGEIRIEGIESQWVGPSPSELGIEPGPDTLGIAPTVTPRELRFEPR